MEKFQYIENLITPTQTTTLTTFVAIGYPFPGPENNTDITTT